LVYDLNTLLLKDPRDQISIAKIGTLFSLFKIANKEGRELFQSLKGLNGTSYWERRKEIYTKTQKLSQNIFKTIIGHQDFSPKLNIESLLISLKNTLNLNDEQLNLETVDSFLFLKKLILGGERSIITSSEIEGLLLKAPDFLSMGMDLLFSGDKEFESDALQLYFYYDIIGEFKKSFYPWPSDTVILDHHDFINIAHEFLKEDYNVKNMSNSIKTIKQKFIGGNAQEYRFRDLQKFLDWVNEFFSITYLNDITYIHHKDIMSLIGPIPKIKIPKLPDYDLFEKDQVKLFWAQFEHITLSYRYFHNDQGLSYYANDIQRFKNGFQITAMLRWALSKIFKVYGHIPEGKQDSEIDMEDVRLFMNDLKSAALEFDLWPTDLERFISEAVFSSDLFQVHADGNDSANIEEINEYLINVLHSFVTSNDVYDNIKIYCAPGGPDGESIDVECFRKNFIEVLFTELNLKKYYQKLYEYLNMNGKEELQEYFKNIELYARLTPEGSPPLTKEEINRIVVVITNLESAFIRFDKNGDGVLGEEELDQTFPIFKNIIIKASDLSENTSNSLFKSIFLFLIKNMRQPKSDIELLWFHVFGKKSDITATRFNIAKILGDFNL
jgi:hypothetical protein